MIEKVITIVLTASLTLISGKGIVAPGARFSGDVLSKENEESEMIYTTKTLDNVLVENEKYLKPEPEPIVEINFKTDSLESEIKQIKAEAEARRKAAEAATNTNKSTYPVYGNWEDEIKIWCSKYGCNWLFVSKIMGCESGRRSNAYNPAGPYIGLFQFDNRTFYANVKYVKQYTGNNISNPNIWNPHHQIQVASWMLSWDKEGSKWPVCSAKAKEEMNYNYK